MRDTFKEVFISPILEMKFNMERNAFFLSLSINFKNKLPLLPSLD